MNGTSKRPMFSWDTCVFLAWFNEEDDKPLGNIEAILERISRNTATLLVSAVCVAEILTEAGRSSAGTKFRSFVKRDNVIVANVDFRIAEVAATFRERAIDAIRNGTREKGIKAPDALIAATASVYKADALHTFDPVLLGLSEDPIVSGLRIETPPADEDHPLFNDEQAE